MSNKFDFEDSVVQLDLSLSALKLAVSYLFQDADILSRDILKSKYHENFFSAFSTLILTQINEATIEIEKLKAAL